jgi:rubrerythrin
MKPKVHEAEAEAKEAKSWHCGTCGKMLEEHNNGPDCRYCTQYWLDVDNGLFDD